MRVKPRADAGNVFENAIQDRSKNPDEDQLLEALINLTSYCKRVGGQFDYCEELKSAEAAIKKATE